MSATVIAHGNSSPIFESAEHDFYFMPLFIEHFVIFSRMRSVSFGRDAGGYAFIKQRATKPIRVVTLIRKKFFGIRQGMKQLRSSFVITHLTCCEKQSNRFSRAVANGVQF